MSSDYRGLNRNQTQTAVSDGCRVRRLTPLEVIRVMDFDDADYIKLREIGVSDAQFYRLAGNSIVVNVICEIFKNLFIINVTIAA
jgi:DNA (cytosine-5)-methyltransferase 1